MPDFVRARADNGAEVTVTAAVAEFGGLTVLKKPAVGNDGRPLPTKLRVSKGAANQPDHTQSEAPASDAQEG